MPCPAPVLSAETWPPRGDLAGAFVLLPTLAPSDPHRPFAPMLHPLVEGPLDASAEDDRVGAMQLTSRRQRTLGRDAFNRRVYELCVGALQGRIPVIGDQDAFASHHIVRREFRAEDRVLYLLAEVLQCELC